MEAVAAGKSDRQAALEAGFTPSMAAKTKDRIWNKVEVQEYYRTLLRRAAPPERIVKKLSDHIDAKSITTKIRKRMVPSSDPEKKGEEVEETIIEKTETIDAHVSLRAIELVIDGAEYVPAKGAAVQVGVGIVLEDEIVRAGESWEPPEWALRMKAGKWN